MHSYSPNSDVFARKTHVQIELTRKETIKRNSFGGPDTNRHIDKFLRDMKEKRQ